MSNLKMYSVHDAKAEAYLQPFCTKTRGLASRMFTNTVNDENTEFWKHPEDYTLFEIGEYDENSGQLVPHEVHVPIGKALDFKEIQQ